MKLLLTTLSIFLILININAQDSISIRDFESLNNTQWVGTLTYKDYQSGELINVNTTMQFFIEDNNLMSNVQYTYEPSKNYKSKIKIKNNDTLFGTEQIVSFKELDGEITFITKYRGKDNGKKADMYMTRKLTDSTFSIIKKVVYLETNESLIRNSYIFTKIE
ncbi:MAG: hypothetical protein HKN40_01980 [Winogradskyella sp.]|uniref:hypothetical protein n=1 Tax=Winogradskyella sp. TaxID=1883156 RepID=UPI0017A9C36D|nr:hypothetical protein [Winogradskyella sp.]